MANKIYDQNSKEIKVNLRKEPDGTWSRNVWFGSAPATNVRRYTYATRAQAVAGSISDEIGKQGRIK